MSVITELRNILDEGVSLSKVKELHKKGVKFYTASFLVKYITDNSNTALRYSEIRKKINEGGEYYALGKIPVAKLAIQDEDIVGSEVTKPYLSELPIVVVKNYFILDGRHRAVSAKVLGKRDIMAYMPVDLYIKHNKV